MRAFIECGCHKTARRRAPWACVIAEADGGYWAFEYVTDWQTWRGQK